MLSYHLWLRKYNKHFLDSHHWILVFIICCCTLHFFSHKRSVPTKVLWRFLLLISSKMYYFSRSSRFRLKSREEAAWCPLVLVRNIQGFSQGCHDEPARALFHGQGFNYKRRLHLASQVSTLYFCVQRMISISMWQDSLLSWEAWHEHCTHTHPTPTPPLPSPLLIRDQMDVWLSRIRW